MTHRDAVYDEYGELIGYLQSSDTSDLILVIDANGHEIGTVRSEATGRKQLLSMSFQKRQYDTPVKRRRY